MDDFAAQDNVMVAQVPINAGVRTLYAQIGNAFGWLCVTALAACLGLLVIQ
jgi:apolipoprotein N-acyltransferase